VRIRAEYERQLHVLSDLLSEKAEENTTLAQQLRSLEKTHSSTQARAADLQTSLTEKAQIIEKLEEQVWFSCVVVVMITMMGVCVCVCGWMCICVHCTVCDGVYTWYICMLVLLLCYPFIF
jgi:hypothetical protein